MGSPIAFRGFNPLDVGVAFNAVVRQKRAPVGVLEASKRDLTARSAAYAAFATKVAALEAAVTKLATRDGFGGRTHTSTDTTALNVTAGTSATIGTFDIVVNELARAQVTASSSAHSDTDTTTVATGGTLTIGGTTVTIGSSVTLQGLSDAINATAGIGVTATIVSPSTGSYQLVLTGNDVGATDGFLITNSLTGGSAPVSFIDTDTDGTSGDSAADNATQATDAQVVNDITVITSTNTVTSAIPGVTLNLLEKNSASTITVTIGQSVDATKALVDDFVEAFTALETFIEEQGAAVGHQGPLGRGALLRSLRADIRSSLIASYPVNGRYHDLTDAGLGFDADGELTFTKATFDAAAKIALADIRKLFVGGGGQDGAFTVLQERLESYTEAGGLLPEVQRRTAGQLDRLSSRSVAYDDRLAIRRAVLQRELIAAELSKTALDQSARSLSALSGQLRLF